MTTLTARPNTALLVIDVQVAVVADAHARDAVVGNIAGLVDRAREQATPVIWVQHSDDNVAQESEGWQIVPELAPREPEALVRKRFGDSFDDTNLEDLLAEAGVGHLVVVGASTDVCIRSTIHGGLVRGYDVTLVGDAHTTVDLSQWGAPPPEQVIAHTNLYWKHHESPGRTADVVETKEISFGN
ncbi:cysteine hydrolase family protein [Streptomyces sp. NPDC088794]|uniref:cysteine hydrolase family protein n=1 Tax=Streptomyces sp. NPDC088794 TaxID=3365902 RepID=UPI0037F19732